MIGFAFYFVYSFLIKSKKKNAHALLIYTKNLQNTRNKHNHFHKNMHSIPKIEAKFAHYVNDGTGNKHYWVAIELYNYHFGVSVHR